MRGSVCSEHTNRDVLSYYIRHRTQTRIAMHPMYHLMRTGCIHLMIRGDSLALPLRLLSLPTPTCPHSHTQSLLVRAPDGGLVIMPRRRALCL